MMMMMMNIIFIIIIINFIVIIITKIYKIPSTGSKYTDKDMKNKCFQ